ncbi:hypothetical protein [Chitinophaga polysaccharea]|uniref:hypothetical protein n=1 Tax=Chitinophaga polysaccharea TaxID=1293035 RepID=UPI001157B5E9|nr:hypothetical protein [Chitinophaga polysaccharea]
MKTIPLLLVILFFAACSKEADNCSQYGWVPVQGAKYLGKSSGNASGQNGVFYDVSCIFNNSCYSINKIVASKNRDTVVLKAEYLFNTCTICTQAFITQTKTYSFVPPGNGTYYLKWDGIANRVDTITIP